MAAYDITNLMQEIPADAGDDFYITYTFFYEMDIDEFVLGSDSTQKESSWNTGFEGAS